MADGASEPRWAAAGRTAGARLAQGLLAVALCAACAGPTSTDDDYRLKAQQTAKDLTAVAGSAQLAARQYLAGRLPQAYADYVISRAEQDGSSIQNTFDTRQPPDGAAARLRSRVDDPVQQITGDLADLRIALRMDDHRAMSKALDDLVGPLHDLGDVQEAS